MNLQQSLPYRKFIKALGWDVVPVDGSFCIIKKIPFLGTLAKLQRVSRLPHASVLVQVLKDHRVRTLAVEPEYTVPRQKFHSWIQTIAPYVHINTASYLPTKTIMVDLKPPEDAIFRRFTEAKRRAVRRAQKNNIIIKESTDMKEFIRIKNKSAGFLGFITTYGLDKSWPQFAPKHATILLAYASDHCLGGILIIFWKKTGYYWVAGATHEGKKLFAPTLLVWEALKISKKYGCTKFDFVGIWDERVPQYYKAWKGFSKFKEGFGGKEVYYPLSIIPEKRL